MVSILTARPAQIATAETATQARDVLIFANPMAGRGRGARMARALYDRLENSGLRPHLHLEHPQQIDADDLAHAREARAVVAIGGDGTVRIVARRMLELLGEKLPPLLIAPVGTANLMCLHLGAKWEAGAMIDRMERALWEMNVQRTDAATANGKPFLIVAGIGLDASIVHEVNRIRKGPITKTSYILPGLRMLRDYTFPKLHVTVDGKRLVEDVSAMVFVGNIPEYGTGFSLLPKARSDDGLLDVAVLPIDTRGQGFLRYLQAAAGQHLEVEGAAYAQGKHIVVESDDRVPVQVDGEAEGFTPLDVRLLPIQIPFLIPSVG